MKLKKVFKVAVFIICMFVALFGFLYCLELTDYIEYKEDVSTTMKVLYNTFKVLFITGVIVVYVGIVMVINDWAFKK